MPRPLNRRQTSFQLATFIQILPAGEEGAVLAVARSQFRRDGGSRFRRRKEQDARVKRAALTPSSHPSIRGTAPQRVPPGPELDSTAAAARARNHRGTSERYERGGGGRCCRAAGSSDDRA